MNNLWLSWFNTATRSSVSSDNQDNAVFVQHFSALESTGLSGGYILHQTQTWCFLSGVSSSEPLMSFKDKETGALTTQAALLLPQESHSARQSTCFINSQTPAALPPFPKHRNQSFTLKLLLLIRGKKTKITKGSHGRLFPQRSAGREVMLGKEVKNRW